MKMLLIATAGSLIAAKAFATASNIRFILVDD